jgi:uronate dehydrogenase
MAQLVTLGIELPDLHFEVVYGVSDNARSWYDNSNAQRLGYRPQDRSEMYARDFVKADEPPSTAPEDIYQGGGHCFAEGGTRSALAPAGKSTGAKQVKRPGARKGAKKSAAKARR